MKELKGSWLVAMIGIIVGLIYLCQAGWIDEEVKYALWGVPLTMYTIGNIIIIIEHINEYYKFKKLNYGSNYKDKVDILSFINYYLSIVWSDKFFISYWLILGIFIVKIWLDNNLTIKFIKDGD